MMVPLAQLTNTAAGLQPCGPRGLYMHVPFCLHKCHYCDFYSLVETGPESRQPAFTDRLIEEIRATAPGLWRPLETIFVGGGTPTLLAPDLWARLLRVIAECLPLAADLEFSVEANPETITALLLETLVGGGVNRLSLGAQSFDRTALRTLERRHDPATVRRSIRLARAAGITNINLDLIFGIPGQDLDGWRTDLQIAIALGPDHLSCYGLTYEPNTPLTSRLRAGAIQRVDEDTEARMYEATCDMLDAAGYEQYEISNWARPGRACRHNLLYWRNESWWPMGPGAAGHVNGVRWKNIPRLSDYLRVGPMPPITDVEELDENGRMGEILMLGLRLNEGISHDLLTGDRVNVVRRHVATGLLEHCEGRVRFTPRGRLLADTVLAELL